MRVIHGWLCLLSVVCLSPVWAGEEHTELLRLFHKMRVEHFHEGHGIRGAGRSLLASETHFPLLIEYNKVLRGQHEYDIAAFEDLLDTQWAIAPPQAYQSIADKIDNASVQDLIHAQDRIQKLLYSGALFELSPISALNIRSFNSSVPVYYTLSLLPFIERPRYNGAGARELNTRFKIEAKVGSRYIDIEDLQPGQLRQVEEIFVDVYAGFLYSGLNMDDISRYFEIRLYAIFEALDTYISDLQNRGGWTLFYYISGNGSIAAEDRQGQMVDMPIRVFNDIKRMARHNPNINVAILFDPYRVGEKPSLTIYNKGRIIHEHRYSDEINMGEGGSLKNFVWEAKTILERTDISAAHLGLILWGHGSGWMPTSGVEYRRMIQMRNTSHAFLPPEDIFWQLFQPASFLHDSNSDNDSLSLPELKDVFRDMNVVWDFLIFDTCFGSAIEVAYQLAQFVDYMVATELQQDEFGFSYEVFTQLRGNTSTPSFLSLVAEDNARHIQERQSYMHQSLAITDLISLRDLTFLQPFHQFVQRLITRMDEGKITKRDLDGCFRPLSPQYGFQLQDNMDMSVLLRCLTGLMPETDAGLNTSVIAAFDPLVLWRKTFNRAGETSPNGGLAIYFPAAEKVNSMPVRFGALDFYRRLDFHIQTQWGTFLDRRRALE